MPTARSAFSIAWANSLFFMTPPLSILGQPTASQSMGILSSNNHSLCRRQFQPLYSCHGYLERDYQSSRYNLQLLWLVHQGLPVVPLNCTPLNCTSPGSHLNYDAQPIAGINDETPDTSLLPILNIISLLD